jgi:hypothetical protein
MDAPSPDDHLKAARQARFARVVLVFLGAVLAVGAWQAFGVLLYGIEGSYEH